MVHAPRRPTHQPMKEETETSRESIKWLRTDLRQTKARNLALEGNLAAALQQVETKEAELNALAGLALKYRVQKEKAASFVAGFYFAAKERVQGGIDCLERSDYKNLTDELENDSYEYEDPEWFDGDAAELAAFNRLRRMAKKMDDDGSGSEAHHGEYRCESENCETSKDVRCVRCGCLIGSDEGQSRMAEETDRPSSQSPETERAESCLDERICGCGRPLDDDGYCSSIPETERYLYEPQGPRLESAKT